MIVGIYGFIGAGKTMASKYLVKKYDFLYIDGDAIAKEVMEEKEVLGYLSTKYPGIVVNNVIDRKRLREIIFTSSSENTSLNQFIWPLVELKIQQIIASNNNPNIVIEAIGIKSLNISLDISIFITASEEVLLTRVKKRDVEKVAQIKKVLAIQSDMFQQYQPNYVIKTTDDVMNLYQQLDDIMDQIKTVKN